MPDIPDLWNRLTENGANLLFRNAKDMQTDSHLNGAGSLVRYNQRVRQIAPYDVQVYH